MKHTIKLTAVHNSCEPFLIPCYHDDRKYTELCQGLQGVADSTGVVFNHFWVQLEHTILAGTELGLILRHMKRTKDQTLTTSILREFGETHAQIRLFMSCLVAVRLLRRYSQHETYTTVRDLYYREVAAFFGNQQKLNYLLNKIATSFGFILHLHFKIVPSPKGLFWMSDFTYDCEKKSSIAPSHSPIPSHFEQGPILENKNISEILVFEKEAVFFAFKSFLQKHYEAPGFLIMTGKGCPDRASLRFLNSLQETYARASVIIFVDSDVYGLRIFWSYLQLSYSFGDRIILGGVFIHEHNASYLTITTREWRTLINLLREISELKLKLFAQSRNRVVLRRELRRGLLLFKKAEMNSVGDPAQVDNVNKYLWLTCRGLRR